MATSYGSGTTALGSAQGIRYTKKDLLSNYYLPAALTDIDEITYSFSLISSVENFKDLKSIVIDSVKYGSSTKSTGNVDTDTPDVNNLVLGFYMPSGKSNKAGLSVFASMPVAKFLSVETQSAYYPQYMMYLSDSQRMNGSLQFSWRTKQQWDLSFGLHMFFSTGSTVVSRFPTSTSGQPSSSNIDLKVDVKPSFAPSFSFRKKISEEDSVFFSFIGERDAKLAFKANNNVNVFVSPIPINVDGTSSLYYDPNLLNIGWKKSFLRGDLFTSLEWENWSTFKSSVMIMNISGTGSFEQLNVDSKFKDIFTPRIAWKSRGERSWWTAGYAYRPSPVTRSIDESNYLDSDRHVLGVSFNRRAKKVLGLYSLAHSWGVGLQWQHLNKRFVEKQEADSVGYPYYEIAGDVFSVGIHFESEL